MAEFLFAVAILILTVFSPIILLYGFVSMRYILSDTDLTIKFLGIKSRSIKYSEIKDIAMTEQLSFLKLKSGKIPFNRIIVIELSKPYFASKRFVIAPRDRENFFTEFKSKINNSRTEPVSASSKN
ncbi:hypothetical protein ACFL5N_01720 [bacterium]